ncbi:MAG: hypothetical protein ACK56F_27510, partial [bacterium]
MARQDHAVDLVCTDLAVPLGIQPAHEVDAEVRLDAYLKGMFLSVDLDLPQLGQKRAVGGLDCEGRPELHVPGHSGPALESTERSPDRLEHDTFGDLHQPLLFDLHDLPVKIPFDGVNLL